MQKIFIKQKPEKDTSEELVCLQNVIAQNKI